MSATLIVPTAICRIRLVEDNGALTVLDFVAGDEAAPVEPPATPLLEEAARQLREYVAGERRVFDLPLCPRGTPFMLRVWEALCAIPYGSTASYADIAARIGQPGACRAVGMANNRNPLSIVIPCHRVIGKDGQLVGYGGGLHIKSALLELEGAVYAKRPAERP